MASASASRYRNAGTVISAPTSVDFRPVNGVYPLPPALGTNPLLAIDLGGLLCLFDAAGPCANAVKDAQRTKTDDTTRRTLSVIWGTTALPGRAQQTAAWYRQLLEEHGATVTAVSTEA